MIIRLEFVGTVPNFDGLSLDNYEVFRRDAELSRRISSRFCRALNAGAAEQGDLGEGAVLRGAVAPTCKSYKLQIKVHKVI